MPLLGIQFRDVDAKRNTNLVVMDANDFAELLEELKELREVADAYDNITRHSID